MVVPEWDVQVALPCVWGVAVSLELSKHVGLSFSSLYFDTKNWMGRERGKEIQIINLPWSCDGKCITEYKALHGQSQVKVLGGVSAVLSDIPGLLLAYPLSTCRLCDLSAWFLKQMLGSLFSLMTASLCDSILWRSWDTSGITFVNNWGKVKKKELAVVWLLPVLNTAVSSKVYLICHQV